MEFDAGLEPGFAQAGASQLKRKTHDPNPDAPQWFAVKT
jgi:hypothetical protein